MASEILAVPEEDLAEVIAVLRSGMWMRRPPVKLSRQQKRVHRELSKWCDEEEAYLERLAE